MTKKGILIAFLFITAVLSCNKKNSPPAKNTEQELIIFHAGSLSVPFKQMAEQFEKENQGVKVLSEADGSRKCARKITDLNKACDIMASADYTVIDDLLIPEFADWNIKFATNEMTIVYHEKSKYANEINEKNWFEILMKKDVAFGRSEPDSDPCGYRAVLTTKLAEKFYKTKNLSNKMLGKDQNYIRPKETDLLALLESKTIDYIFLYRSVAQQHNLKYIILPDSVNLKIPELSDWYKTVSVDISGKTPGETITKIGEPMIYGITIPKNAPNPKLALKFIKFVLEKENGMKIMEENGQASLIPSVCDTFDKIPEELKSFAKK
jgi:molybdate/tungstate transport system substrate-binding protein